VDEVVLLIYRAPHSYTREDVVEIQGHGGKISAARILRRVLNEGARLAEPGEFTKRAFLSGRIDLVQAEAVADLIAARSEKAAEAALDQLEGSLSGLFNDIYNELLRIGSTAEACLDLDDADIPSGLLDQAGRHLGGVSDQCQALLSTWSEGHVLREA
jgi:tRNA modification GTPase